MKYSWRKMEAFQRREQDLGTLIEESEVQVTFPLKDSIGIPKIARLESSCSCTDPVMDAEHRQLVATYDTGRVPPHLRQRGYKESTKYIRVVYEDGSEEILSFSARVKVKGI